MHYKNGRPARQGDKIISVRHGWCGILYDATEGRDTCDGRIAPVSQNDPYVNIKDCLHLEDIASADIPVSIALPFSQ